MQRLKTLRISWVCAFRSDCAHLARLVHKQVRERESSTRVRHIECSELFSIPLQRMWPTDHCTRSAHDRKSSDQSTTSGIASSEEKSMSNSSNGNRPKLSEKGLL